MKNNKIKDIDDEDENEAEKTKDKRSEERLKEGKIAEARRTEDATEGKREQLWKEQ
jgi:hypothetical protein